jgi:hypothetical protein
MPHLAEMMTEAGVHPVAFYMLGTRQLDLTVLEQMEQEKFCPKATCLVLNMSKLTSWDRGDANPEEEFAQVRSHSTYVKARQRGALEAWMPILEEAKFLEDRGMRFWSPNKAGDPNDLGHLGRWALNAWLTYMERVSKPWASWHLP